MGDLAFGFDLRPPPPTMTQTNTVFVKGFWNDDMLDMVRVEISLFGQIGDAAISTGFLIGGTRDFDSAGKVGMGFHEGFGGDDRCRQTAFHVAGTAPIYFAINNGGPERIMCPAGTDFDNVGMAVEMHGFAAPRTLAAGDDVPPGIFGAIPRGTMSAQQPGFKTVLLEPCFQIFANQPIVASRGVECRDTDQILGCLLYTSPSPRDS